MKLFELPRTRRRRLLKLLLANPELFKTGLCHHAINLYAKDIITYWEFEILTKIIKKHRPDKKSPHYDERMTQSAYYWPVNEWKPREKWIKDMCK